MSKKIAAALLAAIVAVSSVGASFSYELDLLGFDPLHKPYLADKYRPGLSFDYALYPASGGGLPTYVYQDWRNNGYGAGEVAAGMEDSYGPRLFQLTCPFAGGPAAGLLNIGETISLFRNTFTFDHWLSPIAFDFSAQGVMSFVMEGAMADMIAYDGVYFYGATLRIADKVSLRAGAHHYCTHYGDGVLKRIKNPRLAIGYGGSEEELDDFWITYKYVRMNGIAIGLSVEPAPWLRLWGEVNFLLRNAKSWRPIMFRPTYLDLPKNQNYPPHPEGYNALIASFGIELEYPLFKKLGKTRLAYDCHLYEEGKILYKDASGVPDPEMVPTYDPGAPWEAEHSFLVSQEISPMVSFEAGCRVGRFASMAFFYHRATSFFIGARLDPQGVVSLVRASR